MFSQWGYKAQAVDVECRRAVSKEALNLLAIISCRDVSFAYGGHTVIRNLNFNIEAGDYVCILGENGSGKSTLIKGLLGLVKVHSGEILFGEGLKAGEIGYLPQQTAAQRDFPASVDEVVMSGRLNSLGFRCLYNKTDRALADENMKKLNIYDLKHRCFRELSGGQQQRVLLARALCATKKVLLMDEPIAGLDPMVTKEFYHTVQKLNDEKGSNITIMMVSHDAKNSLEHAGKILHLKNEQVFFGSVNEYKNTAEGLALMAGGAAG